MTNVSNMQASSMAVNTTIIEHDGVRDCGEKLVGVTGQVVLAPSPAYGVEICKMRVESTGGTGGS